MNRRAFLGAIAAAPAVAPQVMAAQPIAASVATLGFKIDSAGAFGEAVSQARELRAVVGRIRPFDFGSRKDYVYRTGYPEIDALRSVSAVHKKRMEEKRPIRIVTSNIRGEETVAYA